MLITQAVILSVMLAGVFYFLTALRQVNGHYLNIVWINVIVQVAGVLAYLGVLFEASAQGVDPVMSLETRYAYWLLTTPFLVAVFPVFLRSRAVTGALVFKLVAADIVMLAAGYVGEASMANASALNPVSVFAFGIGLAAFVYLLFELFLNIGQSAVRQHKVLHDGVVLLVVFLAIGWSIYPVAYLLELLIGGPAIAQFSEFLFVVGNLVNKLLFGVLAVQLARRLSTIGELGDTRQDVWGRADVRA